MRVELQALYLFEASSTMICQVYGGKFLLCIKKKIKCLVHVVLITYMLSFEDSMKREQMP